MFPKREAVVFPSSSSLRPLDSCALSTLTGMNQHDTQQPWLLTFKNTASEGGGNDVCALFNLLVFRVLSQEMEDLGALSS